MTLADGQNDTTYTDPGSGAIVYVDPQGWERTAGQATLDEPATDLNGNPNPDNLAPDYRAEAITASMRAFHDLRAEPEQITVEEWFARGCVYVTTEETR